MADHDCDILLSAHGMGTGAGAHAGTDIELPKLLAVGGVERVEPAVDIALEHQISGRGHRAAIERQRLLDVPDFGLLDRVPGDQIAAVATGPGKEIRFGRAYGEYASFETGLAAFQIH